MIRIRVDVSATMKALRDLERRVGYSSAIALTKTAKIAQDEIKQTVENVLDRPTPATRNSTYVKPATPDRPVAEVGFKNHWSDPARHYLVPQVHGGNRMIKRFEQHLRQAGILGPEEYCVPAKHFPLDSYGNAPRSVYAAILADVRANPDERSWSTRESRGRRARRKKAVYFASRGPGLWFGRKQHLPAGIYRRIGQRLEGVFIFVRKPKYLARLPLTQIVQRNIDRHFARILNEQLRLPKPTRR